MEIRRIQPEEVNTVVQMWVDFVDDQFQYDDFFIRSPEGQLNLKNKLHEYLRDVNYLIAGAFVGAEMVGYILAQVSEHPPFFERRQFCNLRHLFVREEYRNKNYGAELIRFTKEWAKQKGLNRIELLVAAKNERAIRFYHNHGFKNFCMVLSHDL